MHHDLDVAREPLYFDAGEAGAWGHLVDQLANFEVLVQSVHIVFAFGKPAPVPGLIDLKAEAHWMYFSTHNSPTS